MEIGGGIFPAAESGAQLASEGRWRFLFELSFSPTRLVVLIFGNSGVLEGANEELLLRTAHTARYFVGNQPW